MTTVSDVLMLMGTWVAGVKWSWGLLHALRGTAAENGDCKRSLRTDHYSACSRDPTTAKAYTGVGA